jgi:CheY-like chemotaxis protein
VPIAPAPSEHPALPHEPLPRLQRAAGTDLTGMKALVVDDDFRNIFALTTILERGHMEVISAESGEDGVALLERSPDVDIVLMDIMMPVMDGYATMRAMRKLPWQWDLPIVAVTANVEEGERQRCIDAGASAYVSKPVESVDFMLVLADCLPTAAPEEQVSSA